MEFIVVSPKKKVKVINIFHDMGEQSYHKFFPWHSIFSIEGQSRRITFHNKEIQFIDSDHRKTDGRPESHFIQLIDLLVGLSSHCLDFVSINKARTTVAEKYLPLLERMMTKPLNINSSFGYARKYLISFFPKKKLSAKQLSDPFEKHLSGCYTARYLTLRDYLGNQGTFNFI
jgi:hypothetical protein